MRIGVPRETKVQERRVGLVPASVGELVRHGHEVWIESGAGAGIGFSDEDYRGVGGVIVPTAGQAWSASLVVKIKEPQPAEFSLLHPDLTLFTYLHLAPDPLQAHALMKSGCLAIAYETVTDSQGGLPLLAPMSAVAGRLAPQVGAHCLMSPSGGRGVLLAGVPGVEAGHVVVLGGGVVGRNAASIAVGMGARVTVIDRDPARLNLLDQAFAGRVAVLAANRATVESAVLDADVVIGAVLVPGAAAPRLLERTLVRRMRLGAVLVDVAIDQGGCSETSRPTTHDHPTYVDEGVVHYCVTNMPGAVPRTAALAINHATLPYVLALANQGVEAALSTNPHLAHGVNVQGGRIVHPVVAEALAGRISL